MNFKISSQNHVIGDTYHANSNANSETLPDGWKKNKSRHEGIDQHDHLTSTKIKNENERQTENTRASSKSKLLDRKSCEEVEMPAKKRKLKDQDTPPYANTVKEKRLKTSNTDINGEEKPLIKGNGMKITYAHYLFKQ
ncbi:hypothetical protein Tco_1160038 [Tanacetum coccineum]